LLLKLTPCLSQSIIMRTFTLFFACLTCAGHGLRGVPASSKEVADASSLKALSTLLLSSNPVAAWQLPGAIHSSPTLRSNAAAMAATKQKTKLKANSWQARLDKALLDLDVREPVSRIRMIQRAFRDPTFQRDVRSAVSIIRNKGMGAGHPEVIEKLWPKGTTARADIEGLAALRKQVPEILEDLQERVQQSGATSLFPSTSTSASTPSLPDPSTIFNSIVELATDPKKQEELQEEAKDLLRSTPKNLETPTYKVVGTIDGPLFLGKPETIELRQYEEFTVAKTNMQFAFGSSSGSTGFTTLASYLFGKNGDDQAMAMTMPVEISSANSEGSMSFVLPKKYADAPPQPLADSDVTLEKVPARLVAVKAFPGVVTDKEVERQKEAVLEALAADGSVKPVDESQISVLQYNSPLTVPWRRRNELAIVVTDKVDADSTEPAEKVEDVKPAEIDSAEPAEKVEDVKPAEASATEDVKPEPTEASTASESVDSTEKDTEATEAADADVADSKEDGESK